MAPIITFADVLRELQDISQQRNSASNEKGLFLEDCSLYESNFLFLTSGAMDYESNICWILGKMLLIVIENCSNFLGDWS